MKKSFLKRAMAAAVAVPVALTQTVLCASLAADETTIDASTFMTVAADAPIVGEWKTDATAREYVQASDWNATTYAALALMAGETYELDTVALADSVASTAWYSELLKSILKNGATANVAVNLDNVVLTINVDYDYAADAEAILSEKLGGIAVDMVEEPMQGTITVTIDTATLYQDTIVEANVTIASTEMEMTNTAEVLAYLQVKLNNMRRSALKSTDNAPEVVALFDSYQAKLDKAADKYNGSESLNYDGFEDYDAVLAQIKADYADKQYADKIPATVEDAVDGDTVVNVMAEVVAQLNEMAPEGYAINLTPEAIVAAADAMSDVNFNATYADGVATVMTDGYIVDAADYAEVYAYFEAKEAELGYEIVDGTFETIMVYNASANADGDAFNAVAALNVERQVSYEVVKEENPEPVVEEEVTATAKGDNFYFSHDDTVLTADMLLESAELTVTTDGVAADPVDVMANMSFGLTAEAPVADLTPEAIYEATGTAYAAVPLYVFYTAADAEPVLVDATVDVYVGVKGDATLTGECDAVDASTVLVFATAIGAGEDAVLTSEDEQLDKFALFLADIDTENKTYDVTAVNATDASAMLVYAVMAGSDPDLVVKDAWAEIMGGMGV